MVRRSWLAVVTVLVALALAAGGQVRVQPRIDLGGEAAAEVAAGARFARPILTRSDAWRTESPRDQLVPPFVGPRPPPGVLAPTPLLLGVLAAERALDPLPPRSRCPVAARAPPRA